MELPPWVPGADEGNRRDTGERALGIQAEDYGDQGEAGDVPLPGAGKPPPAPPEQRFPAPPVIGQPPSFGPFLGPLPESMAAASGLAVPDTVLDGAELPGLTIRGASLRGDDHHARQEVRQDSMGMWRVCDGATAAILVCAADGVGSQPLSHLGAAHACAALRNRIGHAVSGLFLAAGEEGEALAELCDHIVSDICRAIDDVARQQGVEPKALSTTLAAALIEASPESIEASPESIEASPESGNERRYVILNVGDATAFVLRDGEFLPCLAESHDAAAPITSTGTWALPASVGPVGTAAGTIGARDMLMVCTDGMSNPMLNRDVREQLARWWGGGAVPSLPEFGWQLSYRVRTFSDDRTAVCVWGRGQ